MAYIVIEVNASTATIGDLNERCEMATKGYESVQGVINLLEAINGGERRPASVKIVTKDVSTTISTSGTGSASNTFTF